MNHLIGQKIAITTNKPQTTRNRIQTVYTGEKGQIVFLDTPSIHKAKNKLGRYMVQVAERTLSRWTWYSGSWVTHFIGAGEKHIAERMSKTPVILVINKIDTVKKRTFRSFIDEYRKICDFADIVPVSALRSRNLDTLLDCIFQISAYGPCFYDEDTIWTSPSARSSLR